MKGKRKSGTMHTLFQLQVGEICDHSQRTNGRFRAPAQYPGKLEDRLMDKSAWYAQMAEY